MRLLASVAFIAILLSVDSHQHFHGTPVAPLLGGQKLKLEVIAGKSAATVSEFTDHTRVYER